MDSRTEHAAGTFNAAVPSPLTAANDRLQRDRAGLTVERDALAVAQDELLARASDLEQTVTAGEAASSAALEMLAERSAKLEQIERDLDDNRRAQEATIRESEQRVLDKSLEAQVADLEKDLASERAGHMEAEVARTSGVEQSATLTKSLHEKEIALQRAEQKVATVEAKFDEHKKATLGDRALFEEKIAKLTEQLDAESAARLFAEGGKPARTRATARRAIRVRPFGW